MTRQPRKQRNQAARAPLHKKQKQVRSTLSEDLREEYGRRRARVNEGDTVEVMRGDFAGEEGEVLDVDLKSTTISVEGVTLEKADGEEVPRRLEPSNVRITEVDLDDERRQARLEGDAE
ncbi:50S ribosomal protein L24 [Haloarchaeobius amylolyticus]|uniref:50S ribosomal protein L24 n=1 Tax=Haloarchaeobius amylolyticus TaxID=1198296 RepID=UPI00227094E9|nr:50S ribosomal protein L24 [Haloarchaeobius amylolyticus]